VTGDRDRSVERRIIIDKGSVSVSCLASSVHAYEIDEQMNGFSTFFWLQRHAHVENVHIILLEWRMPTIFCSFAAAISTSCTMCE